MVDLLQCTIYLGARTIKLVLVPLVDRVLRLFSQAYCVAECIGYFHPSVSRAKLFWVEFCLWWLSGTFTSLLYIFRIVAVYPHSNVAKYCLPVLWSCWVLCTVMLVFGPGGSCKLSNAFSFAIVLPSPGHLRAESFCHVWGSLTVFCVTMIILKETVVFLGISYPLVMNATTGETWLDRSRSFITGKGLY